MSITVVENNTTITIGGTDQIIEVAASPAVSLSISPGVLANNIEVSGTAAMGQSFVVNNLVFQDGDTVYLADQSNLARPAVGIVTRVSGTTIFHTTIKAALSITPGGSAPSGHKTLYLATAGGVTFTAPEWGAGVLSQIVGYVTKDNGDTTYDTLLNCSNLATPV